MSYGRRHLQYKTNGGEVCCYSFRKKAAYLVMVLSELAKNTLEALANNEDRILLTLATEQENGNRFSDSVETF
jgi:hypothetical protein